MPEPIVTTPPVDVEKQAREAADKAATKRANEANEMFALGDKFNMREEAMAAVSGGKTLDQFRAEVIASLETKKPIDTQQGNLDMTPKDVKRFNLMRAIQASILGDWKHAGFEREVSLETAKKMGLDHATRGFYVPNDVLGRAWHDPVPFF